jgi:hypothetical protein
MTHRDELPLQDYDHLSEATLEHRIRSLREEELHQLLDYERRHANRLPVIALLTTRLDQLERGATPTSGSPNAERPEQASGEPTPPSVGPATAAESETPLRHGTAEQTPRRGRS